MTVRVVLVFMAFILFFKQGLNAQEQSYPYCFVKADYYIAPAALLVYGTGLYIGQQNELLTLNDVTQLNANSINSFDRSATNHWNESFDNWSNAGKYTLFALPCVMLVPPVINGRYKNAVTYSAMYFETLLVNLSLTELSKNVIQRKRPGLYNSDLTIDQKMDIVDEDGGCDSFFSGHASLAFSSAVFLSKTVTDIYGKGTLSTVIWVTSLSLASATGYLRYASGEHFPTDIIAGAAVGSLVGYFIPVLHKNNPSGLSFFVQPNGFNLAYHL